ncbi:hypothetical protein AB4Y43_16630 [Paraburkholderia sp. BR10872]|uniref:hypothetical protein n=1 Tax=Paraburkholderia sp. BR10872 TaxID=3236989 RepID=UPI0034D26B73
MQYLTSARAVFNPLSAIQHLQYRLHLKAVEHAPLLVAAAAVGACVTRLWIDTPALAAAMMLLIAVGLWRAGKTGAQRDSVGNMLALAMMLFVITSLGFAPEAHATIGDMVASLQSDGTKVLNGIVYGCYGGGVVSTAVGINNGIKKSRGDQQVTNGHVFGYGLGGPALGGVGWIMSNTMGSMGGSSSSLNALPAATN